MSNCLSNHSQVINKGDHVATDAFEELEKKYDEIVNLMPDDEDFDSHDFILVLAQKYQRLYIEALDSRKEKNRPFHRVHMAIAKRLKKRVDLVTHIRNCRSKNIFGQKSLVAVWCKVK
jgi:hypothetical protein